MDNTTTVYLACLMRDEEDVGIRGWNWLAEQLSREGFTVKSTLRNKYLVRADRFEGFSFDPVVKPYPVILKDLEEIRRSDIVVLNFERSPCLEPSLGTFVELGYAAGLGKFIVTVTGRERDVLERYPFVRMLSNVIVDYELDALEAMIKFASEHAAVHRTEGGK